jgi:hypothetical protein
VSFALDVALGWYVEKGMAIFPCEKKKPLIALGFKAASRDPVQVEEWWKMWPKAQFGVPTGQANNLLVVDIDGQKGQEWLGRQNWGTTFTVETSPGHLQLWFRQPNGVTTKCSAGQIAPEVDIRGDGGYVIGPFSFHHETKRAYTPRNFDVNPIEAPASLLALTTAHGDAPPFSPLVGGDEIPMGHRHRTMVSFAGGMRARGLSAGAMLVSMRIFNQQHCKPPLDDPDLERIARDIGKKSAGFRGQQPLETCAEVEIESFANVPIEKLDWLWPNRIATGKLNLFVGDPEKGKSLVSLDVAARVSKGKDFPDGTHCECGGVLVVSCEDDPGDTVAPRLIGAGADLARAHRIKGVKVTLGDGQIGQSLFNLERDTQKLEVALEKFSAIKLIIIDPVAAYMGKIDTHVDSAVRAVLGPLAELAAKRKIAVIGIMHLRKADAAAMLRVSGSIGFVAASRVVWGFGPDPDNPERRIMVCIKNNLGPKASSLAYKIVGSHGDPAIGVIEWQNDTVTFTPDEVLDNTPRRKYGQTQKSAEQWLLVLLAGGPMPQRQIEPRAAEEGFSWGTILRAKKAVGIKSRKLAVDGGWEWRLGEDAQTDRTCSKRKK